VDPALAIQLAKRDAFLRGFGFGRPRQASAVLGPVQDWEPKGDIPPAPEKTVAQKSDQE
jgi:hypothetical protein